MANPFPCLLHVFPLFWLRVTYSDLFLLHDLRLLHSLQSFPPRSGQWTRLGSTMMTESRLAMGLNRHPATVASQNVTPKRRRPTAAALREASCPTNTPKQATFLRQWTPTLLRRIQSTSLCRLHRIATMGGHNRLSTRTARRALPTVTIT